MKNNSSKTYKPSKRNWVKLWVDEWLGGTTRFELSEKQRAIWIDLMAMAGKSRYPGIVASGKYDDGFRGYPISYLAGTLVYDPLDFTEALKVCEKYGKIKIDYKNHDGQDNVVIYVNNWDKYQSEYLRQKKYSDGTKGEVQSIFVAWNNCQIIVHKVLDDRTLGKINSALSKYSASEIKKAIENYANVLADPDKYFFKYKWILHDFLVRGVDKFVDSADPLNNYLRDTKGVNHPKSSYLGTAGSDQETLDKFKRLDDKREKEWKKD